MVVAVAASKLDNNSLILLLPCFHLNPRAQVPLAALSQTELDFVCWLLPPPSYTGRHRRLAGSQSLLRRNRITYYLFLLAITNCFLSCNKSSPLVLFVPADNVLFKKNGYFLGIRYSVVHSLNRIQQRNQYLQFEVIV